MMLNATLEKKELVGEFSHERQRWDNTIIGYLKTGEVIKGDAEPGELVPGLTYRFMGTWKTHFKYGDQFIFEAFVLHIPHNKKGVCDYLAEFCPGVGKKKAERLWEAFGASAVEVLRTLPEQVIEMGILDTEAAQASSAVLKKQEGLERTTIDLFGMFNGRGFPKKLVKQCIRKWGIKAYAYIKKDPFHLLVNKLNGCSFNRVDKLYLDEGHPPERLKRQTLCGWAGLRTDTEGHTWYPSVIVRECITDSIPGAIARPEKAITLGTRAKWLIERRDPDGRTWLTETKKAVNEQRLAIRLRELSKAPVRWPNIEDCRELGGTGPTDHQIAVMKQAIASPIGILSGTPGVGKTYVSAALAKLIINRHGATRLGIGAPTGKAAVRIKGSMQKYGIDAPTKTLHSMLGVVEYNDSGWVFRYHANNPLRYEFIIVDEWSMGDVDLAAAFLSACANGTHILFVGDPYQLPPVGHGAPLRDMIESGKIAYGELTEIKRNAGLIVHACRQIKEGRKFDTSPVYKPEEGLNLRHVQTSNPTQCVSTLGVLLDKIQASGKFNIFDDVQVLVARNKQTPVSRQILNTFMQERLNPDGLQIGKNPFRVSDKIICLKNSPNMPLATDTLPSDREERADFEGLVTTPAAAPSAEKEEAGNGRFRSGQDRPPTVFVANGEIGRVTRVEERVTTALFQSPKRLIKIPMGVPKESENPEEESGKGCDFDLAYAITGHKAQGSEWKLVIVMIDKLAGRVSSREWVYTAISRASELCILIGDINTIYKQCGRVSIRDRKTFLKELLTSETL